MSERQTKMLYDADMRAAFEEARRAASVARDPRKEAVSRRNLLRWLEADARSLSSNRRRIRWSS